MASLFSLLLVAPSAKGLRHIAATIKTERKFAEELLKTGKIRIGWVQCEIRKRIQITRCFRCLGHGHRTGECQGEDKAEKSEGFVKLSFDKWQLYGCYISPNIPIEAFKTYIDGIMINIRDNGEQAIFAGDLNAKSITWSSPLTDNREKYIEEWVAELDLVIINSGDVPTFERGSSWSFIDADTDTTENRSNYPKRQEEKRSPELKPPRHQNNNKKAYNIPGREIMQRSKEYWEKIRKFVGKVMQQKKKEERVWNETGVVPWEQQE
ncbi:hypothetical protein NQ314_013194 [Rhamnusium bicolor]|uniref:Endonuclease/exonuclease/phosphatase domain-containing protein n=1 Tax=Rhamnusium bicolor TaxID=1586634 RepID=A0AAV8X7A4_9CUCU|nr:hypothetical protein NQ314_013194 [Rhamnusium bicolor]